MEKLDVPTAVVNTESFIASSRAMAVAQGIPDYPFVIIPHPIAATEKVVLEEWADKVIEEIVDIFYLLEITNKTKDKRRAGVNSKEDELHSSFYFKI